MYNYISCPMQQRVVVCVMHTHFILTSSAAKGATINLDVCTLLHPRPMSHGGVFLNTFWYLIMNKSVLPRKFMVLPIGNPTHTALPSYLY